MKRLISKTNINLKQNFNSKWFVRLAAEHSADLIIHTGDVGFIGKLAIQLIKFSVNNLLDREIKFRQSNW